MKKITFLKSVLLAAAFVSTSAFASTLFNNSAAFNATLGSTVVDTYESSGYAFFQNDAQMSSVLGETKYHSTGFNNLNLVPTSGSGHYYCAGCNGTFKLDFTSTSVSGVGGVFGVGFNFFNYTPSYNAYVTYGNGSTEEIVLGNANFPASSFWGVTSNLLVSSIHFSLPGGGTTTSGSFGIDNLTIGNAAHSVPETGSFALFGLGLAALMMFRRKNAA